MAKEMEKDHTGQIFKMLADMDKKQDVQTEKVLSEVKSINTRMDDHMKDHPHPLRLTMHLEEAKKEATAKEAAERVVSVGVWGMVFRVMGTIIGTGLIGAAIWVMARLG